MADERDEEKTKIEQATGGQQSHRSEYGRQDDQTTETEAEEIRKEAFGGSGGQPIGGNDSATGTGTTLTQGYGGAGGTSSTGGSMVGTPGGTVSKEALPGGAPDTVTSERTSGAGDEMTGQAAGFGKGNIGPPGSTGEGFIAAQGPGTDEYLQEEESASSAKATGGTDFANQGRGAPEDEEEEAGAGARDVGSGGPGSSV